MIRHDKLSMMLVFLAFMLTVYLATFETTSTIMFPGFLLIIGVGMEMWLEKKRENIATPLQEQRTMQQIAYYTAIALVGIFATGIFVSTIHIAQVSSFSSLSFTVLMAISEEQFFRGFITDFLLSTMKNPMYALFGSAFIFMFYHYARYGLNQDAMIYAFLGGFVLSWVAYKSRRISPCMLAHVINNIIALGGFV